MKFSKLSKRVKIVICVSVAAVICIAVLVGRVNADAARQDTPVQTITLERTDLTRTLSASGVVQSANVQNIFSTQTSPVREIFVDVGDRVEIGDVLAVLDMSRLEGDILHAGLNLASAELSYAEEIRANAHSVTSAATSLEASRISLERQALATSSAERDLREAMAELDTPFDTRIHDRMIEDAELNLERRQADYLDAQRDFTDTIDNFDDFVHMNLIEDARVNLDRRYAALVEAREDLESERNHRDDNFDENALRQAVTDAETNLRRRQQDLTSAQQQLSLVWELHSDNPLAPEIQSAQTALTNASRGVEDARTALTRANSNLQSARDNQSDLRENAISAAERVVETAEFAYEDAKRIYERANLDLERAKDAAIELAENNLNRARNNLTDSQRSAQRALADLEMAIQDFMDAGNTRLRNASRNLEDSRAQLRSARNSVTSAENSLNQAADRPETSHINVEMQELNIERLSQQLDDGYIIATAAGVIAEVNASVGAPPTGILFVIVDVENLYISANVREHTLHEIHLGQTGIVTTVATGDRVYDAEVNFISPRAVSPPGSTSVEFEIRAMVHESDMDIRIGMNAFLDVIIEYRQDVYVVPLTAISTNENGSFVYAVLDNERWEIPVLTGLRTSTHTEIYGNGLFEGLEILARPFGI